MVHPRADEGKYRLHRQTPPASVYRLAAWLSLAGPLARELCLARSQVPFPPDKVLVRLVRQLWAQRLVELRRAGLDYLQDAGRFNKALDCRPHAFSYGGEGRVCCWRLCPFCNARVPAAAGSWRVSGDAVLLLCRAGTTWPPESTKGDE